MMMAIVRKIIHDEEWMAASHLLSKNWNAAVIGRSAIFNTYVLQYWE